MPAPLAPPASAARRAALLGLVAALLVAVPACSSDSYLVLDLRSDGTSFVGITKVVVEVTAATGRPMVTRTFSVGGATGVTIDANSSKSLSVSFTPDRSGVVNVKVSISGASGCVATGTVAATIDKGGVARATVTVAPSSCNVTPDGGIPDTMTTFPGCDPAVPGSCPATQTCYVDCSNEMGRCVPGGAKGPGELCTSNNDCAPGTQCFDFNCPSTTRVCLKFCAGDDACAALSTAEGTSTCRDPVFCPALTSYKTCGFVCDPRGTATSGCPAGLNCFLFADQAGGQDSPSCGCPAATRVGTDGTPCTASEQCAPGFICDQMTAGQFCRRLCKMNDATASGGDCPGTQTCTALTNNTVFGVCN